MVSKDRASRPTTSSSKPKRVDSSRGAEATEGVVSFEKKRETKYERKGAKPSGGKTWNDKKDFKSEGKSDMGKRSFKDADGKYPKKDKDAPKQSGAPILNRRQKQKVSDLIKQLRINHAKLNMKKKEVNNAEKHELVAECIKLIGNKYTELCYKHDGCRMLQALVKYGNRPQRIEVVNQIKGLYTHLMESKYAHYLASKAYYYAPEESQKAELRQKVQGQIQKLLMHTYGSEVVEYIYCQGTDNEKRQMVQSLYSSYYLLMKEFLTSEGEDDKTDKVKTLAEFIKVKPNLAEGILEKLEKIVQKIVHKGLTRHSISQAILKDYLECCNDKDKIQNLADLMKEKLPALLASKEGLAVACGLFSVLEAKDRKIVVKSLPIGEMATNKIAHLFLIHIDNTLDDTQLSKKKVLHEALKQIDELIGDKHFQSLLASALVPATVADDQKTFKNMFLVPEDLKAFSFLQSMSTSKKDGNIRAQELFKICQQPLGLFFEEKLSSYLSNVKEHPVLKHFLLATACYGACKESDLIDEMLRQVQKQINGEIGLGHPDLHRVIKDMVKAEAQGNKTSPNDLHFSKTVAGILMKDFEKLALTRAVFIIVELIENESTKPFVWKVVKAQSALVARWAKENPKSAGLQTLLKKLQA